MPQKITWAPARHENAVEKFYGIGVEKYGEYHNGYLNFGLWDEGVNEYLPAAENLIRTLGRGLSLHPDAHLLDVACGMGTQDVFLHREFGCEIDAVDVTWKHVQHTDRRALSAGISDKVRAHHGSAVELPFSDARFTHALCIEGAEHFDTREKFFQEAWRVLQSGGRLALADYVLTRWPKKMWEHAVVAAAAKLWHVPRANYETAESYVAKMEQHGFRVLCTELVGAKTIPGYYFETIKPKNKRQMCKIRGVIPTALGWFVDYSVYKAYTSGMVEYLLIWAEKK